MINRPLDTFLRFLEYNKMPDMNTYENPGSMLDVFLVPGTLIARAEIIEKLGGEWSRNYKVIYPQNPEVGEIVFKLGSKFTSSDGRTKVEGANFMMKNNISHLTRLAPGPDSNVIGILDHGETDHCHIKTRSGYRKIGLYGTALWSTHPYIDGISGEDITEGNLELRSLVIILRTAAEGLVYLIDNDTLHRDIKPDNLLVDESGRARIFDLGIAVQLDKDTKQVTVEGKSGTPGYMSPEQAEAIDVPTVLSPASDIFSLGLTFYEIITGEKAVRSYTWPENNPPTKDIEKYFREQVHNVRTGNVFARKNPITKAKPGLAAEGKTKDEETVVKELERLCHEMISHHAWDRPEIDWIMIQLLEMEHRLEIQPKFI